MCWCKTGQNKPTTKDHHHYRFFFCRLEYDDDDDYDDGQKKQLCARYWRQLPWSDRVNILWQIFFHLPLDDDDDDWRGELVF